MRHDLETIPPGTEFQGDVCVIGGGIAGLILAQKLARGGIHVLLLEAGGLDFEQRSQNLYQARMRGVYHRGTIEGRHRIFGGSSTHWAGQLLDLPDEVFEERQATAHIGWPIRGNDLSAYYPEILDVMGVNDLPFDEQFLVRMGKPPLSSSEVRVRFSKWSPPFRRNLGRTVGRFCLDSPRVDIFLHANAAALDLHPDGNRIVGVRALNYQGGKFNFKGRRYVVCGGTIETARLLLSSTGVRPEGVGNSSDQVGRYFYDHLSTQAALLPPESQAIFKRLFAPYYVKGTLHTHRLESTADYLAKTHSLSVMASFHIEEPADSGLSLFRYTLRRLQQKIFSRENAAELVRLPAILGGALQTAFDLKILGRRYPSPRAAISLRIDTEQKPRADSRIRLTDQLDALGLPVAEIDWKLSDEEAESLFRYALVIDRYLRHLDMNEIGWLPGVLESSAGWARMAHDIYHPMGGTRMGLSPETSVVDRDLRVHGIDNLSIASCSVFPSGGSSNPTFTLMALTLRLADRLRKESV